MRFSLKQTLNLVTMIAVAGGMISSASAVIAPPTSKPSSKEKPAKEKTAAKSGSAKEQSPPAAAQPVAKNSSDVEQALFTKARDLYEKKKYQEAIDIYDKIPLDSYRWPLAKEEKGWAYFRMAQHGPALAEVRSLTNDYLASQIDMEPFLLQSLILLSNCDYKAVFATLKEAKEKMAAFVRSMEQMSQSHWSESQQAALLNLIENKGFKSLSQDQFQELPRRFFLDKSAASAMKAGSAFALQRSLEKLALIEEKRNHELLQHLHLIEVEAVQRAFVPNKFKGRQRMSIPQDPDLMVFNSGHEKAEVWADEVSHIQVDLDLCGSKSGSVL